MNEQRKDILGMLAEGAPGGRHHRERRAGPGERPGAAATAAGRRAAGRADPPQALARANAELSRPGVPFDLAQLKPEQLEDLVEHLDEVTLEVDHPEAKVRLCE